jgi:hypothetical protein
MPTHPKQDSSLYEKMEGLREGLTMEIIESQLYPSRVPWSGLFGRLRAWPALLPGTTTN